MTKARQLLQRMLEETGLSQVGFGRLAGLAERTVQKHASGKVIPATRTDWLLDVEFIRTEPGRATIVVRMPHTTPTGEYRRDQLETKKDNR